MKVLPFEKQIGIETFFTSVEGVGGKLRVFPEDFTQEQIAKGKTLFFIRPFSCHFCIR